ncbi:MAG: hypothetical protein AB1758_24510, partial [Candidatus Eremiobacterota bacterium]
SPRVRSRDRGLPQQRRGDTGAPGGRLTGRLGCLEVAGYVAEVQRRSRGSIARQPHNRLQQARRVRAGEFWPG